MRSAVVGFIAVLILVLTGLTTITIHNQMIRRNELDTNLGAAMEQSMAIFTIDSLYAADKAKTELLISDVIQNLLMKITSDSIFKVEVLTVDVEKGILDVRVKETFSQFGGIPGNVDCRKTVVLEVYENKTDVYYPVSFCVEGELIKQIQVLGGNTLLRMEPTKPVKKGYAFQGWKLDGYGEVYEQLSDIRVMQELKFTAVFIKMSEEDIISSAERKV